MKITKELLEEKRACADGFKAFNRFYPNGFDLSLWDKEVQIKIITKTRLRKYIGWAHEVGLIPIWSMRSADLRSANLTSANLRSADLTSANLRSANLRSANLTSADLRWANLTSANLTSANLTSAYYTKYTSLPAGFNPKSAGMLWIEI